MKHTRNIRAFLCGVLVTLLVVSMSTPALAALAAKTIQVYTGVDVYVDDQKLEPKDVNGNPVEVFAYNGTTYLPVRAVSEALSKPVYWDSSVSGVYIGKHTGNKPTVWLSEMDYFAGDEKVKTLNTDKDNMGNTHSHCILQDGNNSVNRTYYLNGQYSSIKGVVYQRFDKRSDTIWGSTPSKFQIYGDGELLYQREFAYGDTGIDPIEFDVDLSNVIKLKA